MDEPQVPSPIPEHEEQETTSELTPANKTKHLPAGHVILSVLAAAFGVQNRSNLEKDFNARGSMYIYIVAGIVFTTLFVGTLATVVSLILD